ncbi:hypothetical protein AgCh_029334 [Apium graveolens]
MDKRGRTHSKTGGRISQFRQTSGSTLTTASSKDSTSKPLLVGVKKLSYSEMLDRRSKGLCINCEDNFSAGHVCKNKQVFMITTEERCVEDKANGKIQINWDTKEEVNPWGVVLETTLNEGDVSLHAMTSTQGIPTLQTLGNIKHGMVCLLFDSGSTLSFISLALVKQLKLKTERCAELKVTVANGQSIACNQVIVGVKWMMAGKIFVGNLHVSPIGGYGIILGINWMRLVSSVIFDFQSGSITVVAKEHSENDNKDLPGGIPLLLLNYEDLFKEPRGLPPPRALNSLTIKNMYPIPIIEELLAELRGNAVFSKLYLRSGYHQIRVNPNDVHKTAFKTHEDHYEFSVMPFGITNAPASFQALMNDICLEYMRKFVLVFFDDILMYSANLQEHERHFNMVFNVLRKHQLFIRRKKCEFAVAKVEYLGHVVSKYGVAGDNKKIEAMQQWPAPINVKSLR